MSEDSVSTKKPETQKDPNSFVTIKISEKNGSAETYFKINKKRSINQMLHIWIQRRNENASVPIEQFEFRFNGSALKPTDTPLSAGFVEGSHIEAIPIKSAQSSRPKPLPHHWPLTIDHDQSHFQQLVCSKRQDYIAPLMPFPIFDPSNVFPAAFGPDMQQANFLIDPNITYLNHGSFGATPHIVLNAQQKWQQYMEANPCRFFHYQYSAFTAHAIRMLAEFIGAHPEDTVFVDNATTGVNSVIQSLNLGPDDSILYLSIGYGPLINFLKFLNKTIGVELIEVECPLPLDLDKLVQDISSSIRSNTKVALIDHITSGTATILPLEKIIPILRSKKVFSCIDGAHAVGQIPLNMTELNPDAYVSNCHKWLFSSKGCAFLWINPAHHNQIHPLVLSSGTGIGQNAEFNWTGTKDYSPWLSLMTAIQFYNHWGADRIRTYNHNLVVEAAETLMSMWDTKTVIKCEENDPSSWKKHVGSMVTIGLPVPEEKVSTAYAQELRRTLLIEKGIDMICYPLQGKLYCRISAQIYLDLDDFIVYGEDVLYLINAHSTPNESQQQQQS